MKRRIELRAQKERVRNVALTDSSIGSRSWTRTNDPLINSQLLYQLSYSGMDIFLLNSTLLKVAGRRVAHICFTGPPTWVPVPPSPPLFGPWLSLDITAWCASPLWKALAGAPRGCADTPGP